jgi:predicted phosphodiesterase
MQVAALYDIHGNLPALDAVLAELQAIEPEVIVIGGDVGGPLIVETLDRLVALRPRPRFVRGNHDRELVEAFDSGAGPEQTADPSEQGTRWAARRLNRRHRDFLASFEPTVRIEIAGLGPTLFCHGSPRDDDEDITDRTPEQRLRPMFHGVDERVIVCGHSHRQFDRHVLGKRLLNAGAVGMPYEGVAGAFWLLLGPGAELRRTDYDVDAAASRMRASGFPHVDSAILRDSLLEPADPDEIAAHLETRR